MSDLCSPRCLFARPDAGSIYPGWALGVHRYCALSDPGSPDFAPGYLEMLLEAGPGPTPTVAVAVAPPPDPAHAVAAVRAPVPLPLAESLRLTKLRKACPHLIPGGCSCGADVCSFPWRRRRVNHRDCFACLGAVE